MVVAQTKVGRVEVIGVDQILDNFLKEELAGFADGLHVGCEKHKIDSRVLGLKG